MPNQLSKHKKRVSYAEDRAILEDLLQISRKGKRTLTDVIREAVSHYLARQKRIRRPG